MKRFAFRLDAVLRHRRTLLREAQRSFGRVQAKETAMERAILGMDRRRRDCQEQIRLAAQGRVDRSEMLRLRSYANALWLSLLGAGRQLAEVRGNLERRRAEVVAARRDVRALEILRQKALKQWKQRAGREEQRMLDDLRTERGMLTSAAAPGGERP
jgi:flagellar export protein FliJ